MVRPTTNSPPMMRIARRTARRTSGSPALRVSFRIHPAASVLIDGSRSRIPPVSISPQVEALTNSDSDFPACADQSPVGELLRDQPIRGRVVRDAQQRLGNAHERDALLIRQPEFLQEGVEERPLVAARPRTLDQRHAQGHGAMARPAGELQPVQQAIDRLILRPQARAPAPLPAANPVEEVGGTSHSSWRPWRTSSRSDAGGSIGKDGWERQRRALRPPPVLETSYAIAAPIRRAASGAGRARRGRHAGAGDASACSCRTAIPPGPPRARPSCCARRGPDSAP